MNINSIKNKIIIRLRRPKRYSYILKVIRKNRPKKILEVGTWNGDNAIKMCKAAMEIGQPADGVVYYGFDLFELMTEEVFLRELSKRPPREIEVSAKLHEVGIKHELFKGPTSETLEAAIPKIGKVDLVFVDGGHSLETVRSDWEKIQRFMHKETVVIFDDYWLNRTDAGAKPIVDEIDKEKYIVELVGRKDRFNNPNFGDLHIRLAEVRLRF